MSPVEYPYKPPDRTMYYVGPENAYMVAAKEFARQHITVKHVGGALVVRDGKIIGYGSNGAGFHEVHGCAREKMNVPTGTHYELCRGCSYEYHSEALAIRDAKEKHEETHGADLYLWGHWWCCKECWRTMIEAGVKNVYLLEGSERLFNKNNPGNVIGRQFEGYNTNL